MSNRRLRWLVTALRWCGLAGSLVLLIMLICLALWQLPGVQQRVLQPIEQLATDSASTVTLKGVRGRFPFALTIDALALHDARGPWLEITGVVLKTPPWGLLREGLHLDTLTAQHIRLHRLPVADAQAPSQASGGIAVPVDLPTITLNHLAVARLHLGKPILGEAVDMELAGRIGAFRKDADLALSLRLDQLDQDRPTHAALTATWRKTPHTLLDLGLEIQLAVGDGSFFARRLGIPRGGEGMLRLHSQSRPTEWRGQVALTAAGIGFVTGDVGYDLATHVLVADPLTVVVAPALVPDKVRSLLGPDHPLHVNARWHIPQGQLVINDLSHTGPGYRLVSAGAIDLNALQIDARGSLAIDRLEALHPWTGAGFDGLGEMTFNIHGALLQPEAGATLTLARLITPQVAVEDISLGLLLDVPVDAEAQDQRYALALEGHVGVMKGRDGRLLQGGRTRLRAAVHLTREGNLVADELHLDNAKDHIRYAGHFDFTDRRGQGALRLNLQNVAPYAALLGQDCQGPLSAETRMNGHGTVFDLEGQVQAGPLSLAGRDLLPIALAYHANIRGTLIDGHGRLAWGAADRQLVMETDFNYDRGLLKISDATATGPGLSLAGEAGIDMHTRDTTAQLRGRVSDLAPLGALMGMSLAGNLDFETHYRNRADKRRLSLRLSGNRIESPWGKVADIRSRADLSDDDGAPRGETHLFLKGVSVGDWDLTSFDARVTGNLAQAIVELDIAGQRPLAMTLSLGGHYRRQAGADHVVVDRLDGKLDQYPLKMVTPVTLRHDAQGWQSEIPGLSVGEAQLVAAAALGPDGIDVQAQLQRMPLDLVSRFGGPPLQGLATARLQLGGTLDQPTGRLSLDARDFRFAPQGLDPLPALQCQAEARYENQRLRGDLRVAGLHPTPMRAKVTTPARLSLYPYHMAISAEAPVAGSLEGSVDLASITAMLPMGGNDLGGTLDARMRIGGSLRAPRIDGSLALNDGYYENLISGTVLKKIALQIDARNEHLTLAKLSAADLRGGQVSAAGKLTLDPGQGHPVDIRVDFKRAHVLGRVDMDAVIDGHLRLHGALRKASINGTLTARPVEIKIGNIGGVSTETLVVTEINRPGDRNAPAGEKEDDRPPLVNPDLDITLNIDDQLFLRGRGLESTWGGSLKVTGAAAAPRLEGVLKIVRGHFDLFSKRFQLASGSVAFQGLSPPNPYLTILATASNGGINGRLQVQGWANNLEIDIDSEEGLPRDEVLSRLLFGKDATNISALQALQLANALRVLTGLGASNSLDLVGRLQDWLRVDQLDIKSDESGEAALGIGKYLTDDIYLNLEQGMGSRSGKVAAEIKVAPNLSLDTELGFDSRSGVGLNWSVDY